ncbi:MAG TPA: hypothetical protein PKD09_21440 [Aggregatilinea sp.]|nr:hypothetical protein [Aggregatilinea sp.]
MECPECSTQLEVVDLRPPTLDYAGGAPDDDEDWDEEEEEWH